MEEEYLGYCFLRDETYCSPVHLNGINAVKAYLALQVPLQHRVVICDSEDCRIFESLDGIILYPKYF